MKSSTALSTGKPHLDTVIVPARPEGFEETFIGQNCWYAIRISGRMLPKIRYIAAYRTQPDSAITHYASPPSSHTIGPIPFADAPSGSMAAIYDFLIAAKRLADLF